VNFAVESWAPEYGAPTDEAVLRPAETMVDIDVEVDAAAWAPRPPVAGLAPLDPILFIDGVRRVEARVWVTGDDGTTRQGICASYAAGAVRCDGRARLESAEVRRGLFCPAEGARPIVTRHGRFAVHPVTSDDPEDLTLVLQREMGRLEADVARSSATDVALLVVDGPLKAGLDLPVAVGYVKTHAAAYGPPIVGAVVARLAAGERTPLFLMEDRRGCWSWYLRLPGEVSHGWSCIVRCEASSSVSLADAIVLADRPHVAAVRVRGAQGPAGATEPAPHRGARTRAPPPPRRPRPPLSRPAGSRGGGLTAREVARAAQPPGGFLRRASGPGSGHLSTRMAKPDRRSRSQANRFRRRRPARRRARRGRRRCRPRPGDRSGRA
jgi:uncharacterized protein